MDHRLPVVAPDITKALAEARTLHIRATARGTVLATLAGLRTRRLRVQEVANVDDHLWVGRCNRLIALMTLAYIRVLILFDVGALAETLDCAFELRAFELRVVLRTRVGKAKEKRLVVLVAVHLAVFLHLHTQARVAQDGDVARVFGCGREVLDISV